LLGLVLDLKLGVVDVSFLVRDVLLEGSLGGIFFFGELDEGVLKVVLDGVHEVTDLSDGVAVGELGGGEGN